MTISKNNANIIVDTQGRRYDNDIPILNLGENNKLNDYILENINSSSTSNIGIKNFVCASPEPSKISTVDSLNTKLNYLIKDNNETISNISYPYSKFFENLNKKCTKIDNQNSLRKTIKYGSMISSDFRNLKTNLDNLDLSHKEENEPMRNKESFSNTIQINSNFYYDDNRLNTIYESCASPSSRSIVDSNHNITEAKVENSNRNTIINNPDNSSHQDFLKGERSLILFRNKQKYSELKNKILSYKLDFSKVNQRTRNIETKQVLNIISDTSILCENNTLISNIA